MSTTDEALVCILLGLMTHDELEALKADIATRVAAQNHAHTREESTP